MLLHGFEVFGLRFSSVVAGLLTEPQPLTAGLPSTRLETFGQAIGGVRRPAPNSGYDQTATVVSISVTTCPLIE